MCLQIVDEAKDILRTNTEVKSRKKLKVKHYDALLLDFGVDKKEFSEERGGKILRLNAKDLANYFWSREDVVTKYHVYEDGNSEDSYDEIVTSSDDA